MERLKSKLEDRYKESGEDVQIHTPYNTEVLRLAFRGDRVAKVL